MLFFIVFTMASALPFVILFSLKVVSTQGPNVLMLTRNQDVHLTLLLLCGILMLPCLYSGQFSAGLAARERVTVCPLPNLQCTRQMVSSSWKCNVVLDVKVINTDILLMSFQFAFHFFGFWHPAEC